MPITLTGITWILTYNCNLSCSHCFFDVKADKAVLDGHMARAALDSLGDEQPIAWQHVSGGEPLIRPDALYGLLDCIREFGTTQIGIATNGSWGASKSQAKRTVTALKEHGATGVCISADSFHAEGVGSRSIANACEAVIAQGMDGHSWVVSCDEEPSAELEKLGLPVASVEVRSIGHGADVFEAESTVPDAPCTQLCCCMGETTPFDPKMIWIDPHGNVMICYGLVIGNLKEKALKDILDDYSVDDNEVIATLASDGPKGLYHMAVDRGWTPPDKFVDECHVCHDARTFLRADHTEILAPAECYPVRR